MKYFRQHQKTLLHNMEDAELELKRTEIELKKTEIAAKQLYNTRYQLETEHLDKLWGLKRSEITLKNMESRIRAIHNLGINLNSHSDLKLLLDMSSILGCDNYNDNDIEIEKIYERIRNHHLFRENYFS